jgi:gliding motility-associated-like protein
VGLGYQILFPNAFTPNGDGINEYFEGEFTGIARFELRIYNVWGGLISSISHENETKPEFWGWDGNYNDGTPYTQKYFRYVFNAQAMSGEEVNQSGEAVILR